jgi:hypothetical protein
VATGVDRFDGSYIVRMCNTADDGSRRCFPVTLTVSHRTLSATWAGRHKSLPAHVNGTIGADGPVKIALDGYSMTGRLLGGGMNGTFSDNKISASGGWSNHVPVNATWSLSR